MMEHTEIANVWPEWTIVERIGAGSYGVVYKAVRKEHGLESSAAIKVISIPQNPSEVDSLHAEGLSLDETKTYFEGVVNDFINEIRVMESLKGMQNIVSVEDYKVVEHTDSVGWDIFIRMELLTPFPQYLQDLQLSQEEVVKLGSEICQALAICQQKDIIHRDIKPENIFVNDFGFFKLGDFGVARKLENLTGSLSQKGTYNYMAPEVANGTHYDARADIYSLGIVLYRLLNDNCYPFLTKETMKDPAARKSALERRLHGELLSPPCGASPALARVILRACLPDPQRRYQTPEEFQDALNAAAKGEVDDLDATVSVHRSHDASNDTVSVRRNYDPPQPRYNAPPQPSYPQPPQYQPPTYDQVPTFGAPQKEKSSVNKGLVIALVILALIAVISVTVLVTLRTQDKANEPAQETTFTEPMDDDIVEEDNAQDDAQEPAQDTEPEEPEPEPEPEPQETQEDIYYDLDTAVENYLYAYIQDINNGGYSQLNAAIKSGSNLEETQRKFIQNSSLYEDLLGYQIMDHKKISDTTYHVTSIEEYDIYNYDSDTNYYVRQKCVYVIKRQSDGRWLIDDYAENVEQLDKVVYGVE